MFRDPQVLIAGAGPVGLFTAYSLARRGVRVQIIDTGLWPCQRSYALALHPQTISLLKQLGLDQAILDRAFPVRSLGLFDRTGRKAEIPLGSVPMAVVRQDLLEKTLEGELAKLGVEVAWRHELAEVNDRGDSVEVTINRYEKESRGYAVAHTEWVIDKTMHQKPAFVVGADGHDSRVRRAAGIDFPEIAPAQYYAVFEFASDAGLGNETRLVFADRTADVLWPLPGGACRWSFQLPDYSDPQVEKLKDFFLTSGFGYFPSEREKDRLRSAGDSIPEIEESKLKELIAERAPWFSGDISSVTWKTVVRFERRMASSFGKGRLWLAGDSAHLTLPAGIQSMNAGLAEGYELGSTIARVLEGGSSAELADYNRRWTETWKQLHGLGAGLRGGASADPWIQAHAAQLLPCLPGFGEQIQTLVEPVGLQFGLAAVKQ
jgi:2-polyprenyl-6-methoxyphenol hydroxylase-like FAD-dependent oxidoreductase